MTTKYVISREEFKPFESHLGENGYNIGEFYKNSDGMDVAKVSSGSFGMNTSIETAINGFIITINKGVGHSSLQHLVHDYIRELTEEKIKNS